MEHQSPPFTLEEAASELIRLEDIATITRDSHAALRIMLFDLVLILCKTGLMNGNDFSFLMKSRLQGLTRPEDSFVRIALELHIADLLPLLESSSVSGDKPGGEVQ